MSDIQCMHGKKRNECWICMPTIEEIHAKINRAASQSTPAPEKCPTCGSIESTHICMMQQGSGGIANATSTQDNRSPHGNAFRERDGLRTGDVDRREVSTSDSANVAMSMGHPESAPCMPLPPEHDAPSGKQNSMIAPSHDPLAPIPFYHSPDANVTDSTPKQETVRDYRELYEQWKSKQLVYSDSWPEKLPWWTTRWTDFVTASLRADLNNSETIRHAEKEILIKEIEDHTKTRAELARVKQALQNLVTRLDEVHADERYKSVWTCYWIHGGRYTEPKYDKQLEQAQAALSGKEQGNG